MQKLEDIEHQEDLHILGQFITLGESKRLNFNIAHLFTDTPVEVPVIIERSKIAGPTILITGGIHGDEINGMEVVRQIVLKQLNKPKKGTIICIPIVNVFGFINKSRMFPDGRDLNRSFPGSESGSLASRFAYHFTKEILPVADLCLDFHSGGANRFNASQIRIDPNDSKAKKYADIFNAPFTLFEDFIEGSYRETAFKMGKVILLNESGKSMESDKYMVLQAVDGITRILSHFKMLTNNKKVIAATHKNIVIQETKWIRAEQSGFLHIKVHIHQWVNFNEILGTISDPYGTLRITILSPYEGFIININQAAIVYQGDAILHISTRTV